MTTKKKQIVLEDADPKDIVEHILKTFKDRCRFEAERNELLVPLSEQEARIAYYTGLPNYLIEKLLPDDPQISTLELSSRILILETMKSIYAQGKLPHYAIIFEEVSRIGQLKTRDDKTISSLSTFVKEMEILGYQWKETLPGGKIIIEDPVIRFERYMYLNKLKKFRNNSMQWQQIVYVDERLVNESQQFPKPWLANQPMMLSAELNECVFYHAVAKSGFITGMFSNQFSEKDFSKWFIDILLMHLKGPSVIIMDNNPLHGSLEDVSSITCYHNKTEMLRWLTNNNIPCSSHMSKPALFELIKKCNEGHKEYKIDSIIKSQGHEILRLPRHLYDLSLTTTLWDNIVSAGGVGISNTQIDLQNQLLKLLTSISLENWAEYEQSLETLEKELFNIDIAMENFCDGFNVKIN